MTRAGSARVLVFWAAIALCGQPAEARAKWWLTWLDELSGPGPFKGQLLSAELWCFGTPDSRIDDINAEITAQKVLFGPWATPVPAEPAQGSLSLPPELTQMERELELDNRLAKVTKERDQLRTAASEAAKSQELVQKDLKHAKAVAPCQASRTNVVATLVVEAGRWDDAERGDRGYEGTTRLTSIQAIAYFPVHRLVGRVMGPRAIGRAFELGIGFGAYRLTGSTIRESEWWRGSVPLRVRFIPVELFDVKKTRAFWERRQKLRRALQAFEYRGGADWLPGRIAPSAFSGIDTTETNELNPSGGIQIDLGVLVWALVGR